MNKVLNGMGVIFSVIAALLWLLSAQTHIQILSENNNYFAAGSAVISGLCFFLTLFFRKK